VKDLNEEELKEISEIMERLKLLNVASAEEWLINEPELLEVSHKLRVTEIILCELKVPGYQQRRIGATRVVLNLSLKAIAELYLRKKFRSVGELRLAFPGIFKIAVGNFKSRTKEAIKKAIEEKYKYVSDEEVVSFILDNNIKKINDIDRIDYINLIFARKGLHKLVVKTLCGQRCRQDVMDAYNAGRDKFFNEFFELTPKNIERYLRLKNIQTRQECWHENRFLYQKIFCGKTNTILEYLLEKNWGADYLTVKPRKVLNLSCLEASNLIYEKIVLNKIPPDTSLKKIDPKLANYLDYRKMLWVAKAYIQIRSNLLFSKKMNYIFNWDHLRVKSFLDVLGLRSDSSLLPGFHQFIAMRGFIL